jgi:hypothetical protein
MRNKEIWIVLMLVFGSHVLSAQNEATKNVVLYDPLFWKHELRLDAFQARRIREINSEYYEKITTAIKVEKGNRNRLQAIAAESLADRSEQIWNTFHPKQRKKWKKMWTESGSVSHSTGTSSIKSIHRSHTST